MSYFKSTSLGFCEILTNSSFSLLVLNSSYLNSSLPKVSLSISYHQFFCNIYCYCHYCFYVQGSPPKITLPEAKPDNSLVKIPHDMAKIEQNFPSVGRKKRRNILHHEVRTVKLNINSLIFFKITKESTNKFIYFLFILLSNILSLTRVLLKMAMLRLWQSSMELIQYYHPVW